MAASRKNPNKFGFSLNLINFLTFRNENIFSFPSLNRNFALSLQQNRQTTAIRADKINYGVFPNPLPWGTLLLRQAPCAASGRQPSTLIFKGLRSLYTFYVYVLIRFPSISNITFVAAWCAASMCIWICSLNLV